MREEKSLSGLTYEEIKNIFEEWDIKPYRIKQLIDWIYKKKVTSFDEMTNLPKDLISKLKENFEVCSLDVEMKYKSKKDKSKKYIFKTHDGNVIEGVAIKEGKRFTLCISTQIGCKFGCAFCASGKGEYARNLSAAEIIDQIRIMSADEKMTNLVFMGGGEPLVNYNALLRAYRIIISEWGLALGERKITLSTAGFIPGIRKLISSDIHPKLAVSLHAPTDKKRSAIMPINIKFSLKELFEVCRKYAEVKGTKVTFEYILIPDFNISRDDAAELGKILKDYPAKINLIPLNPIKEFKYRAPSEKDIIDFESRLKRYGLTVTVRRSKGDDISAACGQLRHRRTIS